MGHQSAGLGAGGATNHPGSGRDGGGFHGNAFFGLFNLAIKRGEITPSVARGGGGSIGRSESAAGNGMAGVLRQGCLKLVGHQGGDRHQAGNKNEVA